MNSRCGISIGTLPLAGEVSSRTNALTPLKSADHPCGDEEQSASCPAVTGRNEERRVIPSAWISDVYVSYNQATITLSYELFGYLPEVTIKSSSRKFRATTPLTGNYRRM